jgi:hypothetical protein
MHSYALFPKYSTSLMFPLFPSIFVKKCLQNFVRNYKNFRFNPNGKWSNITTHFILPKCHWQIPWAVLFTRKFRKNRNFRETKFCEKKHIFALYTVGVQKVSLYLWNLRKILRLLIPIKPTLWKKFFWPLCAAWP